MKEQGRADTSKGIVSFDCHVSEKSWAHQRRKRREKLKESLAQENMEEREACSGKEAAKQDTGDPVKDASKKCNTGTKADESSDFLKGEEFHCEEGPSHGIDSQLQQVETDPRPLVSFLVRVGSGAELGGDLPSDSILLEMTWIDGQDKNDLYQLFQFFQNKLIKGL